MRVMLIFSENFGSFFAIRIDLLSRLPKSRQPLNWVQKLVAIPRIFFGSCKSSWVHFEIQKIWNPDFRLPTFVTNRPWRSCLWNNTLTWRCQVRTPIKLIASSLLNAPCWALVICGSRVVLVHITHCVTFSRTALRSAILSFVILDLLSVTPLKCLSSRGSWPFLNEILAQRLTG